VLVVIGEFRGAGVCGHVVEEGTHGHVLDGVGTRLRVRVGDEEYQGVECMYRAHVCGVCVLYTSLFFEVGEQVVHLEVLYYLCEGFDDGFVLGLVHGVVS
jgi:hypothetical protein